MILLLAVAHAAPACAGVDLIAAELSADRASLAATLPRACLAALDAHRACLATAGPEDAVVGDAYGRCEGPCADALGVAACQGASGHAALTRLAVSACGWLPPETMPERLGRPAFVARFGAPCADAVARLATACVGTPTEDADDPALTTTPACRATCSLAFDPDDCRGDWRWARERIDAWSWALHEPPTEAELRTLHALDALFAPLPERPISELVGRIDPLLPAGTGLDTPALRGSGGTAEGLGGLGTRTTVATRSLNTLATGTFTELVGGSDTLCAAQGATVVCLRPTRRVFGFPGAVTALTLTGHGDGRRLVVATADAVHEQPLHHDTPTTWPLRGVSRLAGSATHVCAAHSDGLSCWGDSDSGALGTGHAGPVAAPHRVDGLPVTTSLAVGAGWSCALGSDARLRCWGALRNAQLGEPSGLPQDLTPAGSPIVDLTGSSTRLVVRRADGTVGNGDATFTALSGATGVVSNGRQTCGVRDGGVVCDRHGPPQPLTARAVAVLDGSVCALTDAAIVCWDR